MNLLIWCWACWHVILAIVAAIERAPIYQCVRIPGAMRVREFLRARAWVFAAGFDGWLGYYWDRDRRRVFVSFLPCVILRIDLPRDRIAEIFRALGEDRRTRALTSIELAKELAETVAPRFALDSRELSLVNEAATRFEKRAIIENKFPPEGGVA